MPTHPTTVSGVPMITMSTRKTQPPQPNNSAQPLRVGLVGTGYIAEFHARAIQALDGVELVSVCDANLSSAKAFATQWSVPTAFDSMKSMLDNERLDSIHVLAPPDLHHSLAKMALRSGAHVLIEKPMCVSIDQAKELLALAHEAGLHVGVVHNMLYAGAYQRLRETVKSGIIGPLEHVSINHFIELKPIRLGPFDSWMLRAPGNVFLEIGPHLISALLDLVGPPNEVKVIADRKADLPGGGSVYRRWRILTAADHVAADINIDLSPGFPQRTIHVRGMLGTATVDFDANSCTIDRRTPLSTDLDRYRRSRSLVHQLRSQARETLADYVLSKLKLRGRGNPYQITFLDSVASFYAGLRTKAPLDARIDGRTGSDVIEWCSKIIGAAGVEQTPAPRARLQSTTPIKPTVLVIGGTGFIGRELIRQLLAAKFSVRAAVRGSGVALEEFDSNRLEIVRGDLRSEVHLKSIMDGIKFVYHLGHASFQTWEENLQQNVEPTRLIAECCLAAGVKRLIYTSTIDSYYAGAKAGTITEQTPLDRNIRRRNYYARAKAAIEAILMEMHRTKGLAVVIFRPGIVIGRGGNPFHFGVGNWVSEGVCEVWGDGNNKLPFVLVSDVAAALLRGVQVDGIEGRSYNLIDSPLLTARDYIDELQRRVGLKIAVHYIPIWRFYLTDLFKWFVKMVVRHPDRVRIPSYSDWESRTQKALFDCSQARVELGWAPASNRQRLIDEGIGGSLELWAAACK